MILYHCLLPFLLFIPLTSSYLLNRSEGKGIVKECAFYNSTCIKLESSLEHGDVSKCQGTQQCSWLSTGDDADQVGCIAVWVNNTLEPSRPDVVIHMQGCIADSGSNNHNCRNQTSCLSVSPMRKHRHLTCCCDFDNCNKELRWEPQEVLPTPVPPVAAPPNSATLYLLMYTLVPCLVGAVIGTAACYVYRQRKNPQFNALPTLGDDLPLSPPTPSLTKSNIQLLEIKARGRFGAVWKGQIGNEMVAVKIFPLQDKQSWYAEQEIYSLAQLSHENILKFIGIEKRGENLQLEFWLVTAFHERGSLCDYLKSNTLSWDDLCRIAYTMCAGLAHLHEEIPSTRTEGTKPAIAHRDFKSKNVLIQSDMTACIGDFGLAKPFRPNEMVGDTHGQVGTRRYMAPEVLEGAINFSRDAFLRIDMYACGLVLWEISSRCTAASSATDYKLPFEAETVAHPSLEEISELVVLQKVRPELKETWKRHPGLSILCETIDECWDHDAEARLSASCVLERIYNMKSLLLSQETRNNILNVTNPLAAIPPSQVIRLPMKETSTEVTFEESSST